MWLRFALVVIALDPVAMAQTLDVVSAASLERGGALAPDMIAIAFSMAITSAAAAPEGSPLPLTLAGYSIRVRDSAGKEISVPLFQAMNGQIRFLLPESVAAGAAT